MEKNKVTNPKLKLAFAIAVPLMVMIVTISMVGASFAWFSDSVTTEISTINLTTKDVFELVFESISSSDENKYTGETAFSLSEDTKGSTSSHRYLISDYRAIEIRGFSKTDEKTKQLYQVYMQDAPFEYKTTVNVSSDDRYVDMTVNIDSVIISKERDTIIDGATVKVTDVYDSYGQTISGASHNYTADKIPYLFTWYMTKGDETKYYTPYGTITYKYDSYGCKEATYINSTPVTSSTSILNQPRSGMKDFYTNGTETFNIYIVLCPEKLYWSQFFKADRNKALVADATNGIQGIYSLEEANYIVRDGLQNAVYYSSPVYYGTNFAFVANMSVSNIDWTRTVSEKTGE